MRIERDPQPLYRSEPIQASSPQASEVSFRSILAEFFAATPFELQTSLHLSLSSGSLDNETPQLITEQFHEELHEDTLMDKQADQEEIREDEIIEDIEENQEIMEDLVDQWEDAGKMLGDKKEVAEKAEPKEDLSEIIEENDDIIEGEKPLEDLLDKDSENKQHREDLFESALQKKAKGHAGSDPQISERDLTYEEIQMLVETTVNSKDILPHAVRRILHQVLDSLMNGRPYLLQVSNMMGLEKEDWYNLLSLFPGQFYDGILRQYKRSNNKSLPIYSLLQEAFLQTPPTPRRQQQWEQILRLTFPDWPLLVRNWLQNQPLLYQPEDQGLKYILEIWKQQGSLPPGAVGRSLELALAHQHHPEAMHRLFVISQSLLHGNTLDSEQAAFYLEKVYERCFHSQFSDTQQMRDLLQRAFDGEDFAEHELSQLVQGCPQQVLSFLPYSLLSPGLQSLIDYIQRDLFGNEEAVPQLLLEEGVN